MTTHTAGIIFKICVYLVSYSPALIVNCATVHHHMINFESHDFDTDTMHSLPLGFYLGPVSQRNDSFNHINDIQRITIIL